MEKPCEVALVMQADREGDFGERKPRTAEQHAGLFDTPFNKIAMRGFAGGRMKGMAKMVHAHAEGLRHISEREVVGEMRLDEFLDPPQLAWGQNAGRHLRVGIEIGMVPDQMHREDRCQCLGASLTASGIVPCLLQQFVQQALNGKIMNEETRDDFQTRRVDSRFMIERLGEEIGVERDRYGMATLFEEPFRVGIRWVEQNMAGPGMTVFRPATHRPS